MKTTTRILTAVAAAASLALAGGVFAQSGYGPGPGFGMGWGMGPGWGGMGAWGGGPGWGHMGGWGGGPGWGHMGGWGGGPGWGHMGGWGGGPGWGHMGGFGMGFGGYDMNAAAASRLAALKDQLQISPAQESAWKAYEGAVTQQATAMQAIRDQIQSQWQNAKPGDAPPDMSSQYQAMFALRQSSWEAQNKALKDLSAVLTPQQQAVFSGGWVGPRGLPRR